MQIRHTAAAQFGLRKHRYSILPTRAFDWPPRTQNLFPHITSLLFTPRLIELESWKVDDALTYRSWQRISSRRSFLSRSLLLSPLETRSRPNYYTGPTILHVCSITWIAWPLQPVLDVTRLMAHFTIRCGNVHLSGDFGQKSLPFISSITQIPNICNPLRCLLGYIDDEYLKMYKPFYV